MKRHALTIVVLMAVAAGVQAWCVSHAVVPAQDAVRFTRMAEAIDREGILTVLRTRDEQPLYSAAVWLAHAALGATLPGRADTWAISAQCAAALALILSVAPLYGLLACLVRWQSAAAGTLFFCLMTSVARLGADALSDSTHLCLLCCALWAAAQWFRQASGVKSAPRAAWRWLLVSGVLLSVAALARKEALIVAPAIVASALLLQRTAWRRPWRELLIGGAGLAAGMLIILVPFFVACDALTPLQAAARLLGQPRESLATNTRTNAATSGAVAVAPKQQPSRWRTSDGQRMAFDKKDSQSSIRFRGYAPAALELARELPAACNHWIGGLALWGAWSLRHRRPRPAVVFLLTFAAIYLACLIHFAAQSGYLASRHLLPMIVLSLGLAGEGAWRIGLAAQRLLRPTRGVNPQSAIRNPQSAIFAPLVALAALACLPRTLAPLHASRQGHRQAAEWLSAQSDGDAAVLDTRGFTQFFTGRMTYDFEHAKQALRDEQLGYLVVERRELDYDSRRGRTLRELVAKSGRRLATFAADQSGVEPVEVYGWRK